MWPSDPSYNVIPLAGTKVVSPAQNEAGFSLECNSVASGRAG